MVLREKTYKETLGWKDSHKLPRAKKKRKPIGLNISNNTVPNSEIVSNPTRTLRATRTFTVLVIVVLYIVTSGDVIPAVVCFPLHRSISTNSLVSTVQGFPVNAQKLLIYRDVSKTHVCTADHILHSYSMVSYFPLYGFVFLFKVI